MLPATTVIAATRTSGARRAIMSATASSDAVSVSIKKVRVTGDSIAEDSKAPSAAFPERHLTCGAMQRSVQFTLSKGEHDVHATKSDDCVVDDDHQRHLLGFLGQHLQGCQELPLRAFLL